MKKEVKNKKMTIDKLAILVAKGFASTATKDDIKDMATKTDIERIQKEIEGVKNQLAGTNKRIDDYAETKVSKIQYKDLENRVVFVEKKLEIKK